MPVRLLLPEGLVLAGKAAEVRKYVPGHDQAALLESEIRSGYLTFTVPARFFSHRSRNR